jgi:hypothetical protein
MSVVPSRRRSLARFGGPAGAALVALVSVCCGLFASPGDYTSGGADDAGASLDGAAPDGGGTSDGSVILPDGQVVPQSTGTLTLLAGSRDPTSPEDDPAWSADAWSGVLDAAGHVASWRVDKSAPIVGPFDSAGLVAGKWVTINVGFGLNGGRGTALQQTSWAPGVVGDWRAARATGAPGGLDELTRVFFGAHVAYVGGTRTVPVDGGSNTSFTDEVHVSTVDVASNALGPSSGAGVQLVVARSRPGVVFGAGALYVVGGRSSGGLTASVERAAVDPAAGTVQAFAEQPAMSNAGADHKVFLPGLAISDGHLWVAGGRTSSSNTPTDVVLSATLDATTGALSAWKTVTKLPKPLRDFAFVAYKGRLYVAGGVTAAGRSDEVFSSAISGADGSLGPWETANAKLPGARSDFVALAY